jgi:hypothetical protein
MLRAWQINEVHKLFEAGHTQRSIAAKTGLARKTIQRVLRGPRPGYEAEGCQEVENSLDIFTGPIGRCPTCGAMVHIPCFGCQIQAKKEADKRLQDYRRLEREGRVVPLRRLIAGNVQ